MNFELKDPAKISFEMTPVKKTSLKCSLLSGASVQFIKTTAANGNKLNISSKVKYHHLLDSYVAAIDVSGTGIGSSASDSARPLPTLFARSSPAVGPIRDQVN